MLSAQFTVLSDAMIACRPSVGQNGFGNEFLNVAKALVCSKELGAYFIKPRWPSPYETLLTRKYNERSYWLHRLRWLRYRLTHRCVEVDQPFCEKMVDGSITDGVRSYMAGQGISTRDNVMFRFSYFPQVQLLPGIGCVLHQIDYLQTVLLSNREIATEVDAMAKRFGGEKLSVGVHIRRGDFLPEVPFGVKWPVGTGTMDEWCRRVPIQWYRHVCSLLRNTFGGHVQFFLSSNSADPEVTDFERDFSCLRGVGGETRNPRDVVDLLTLARTDLLVASPSWFSMWALSFSGKPFCWYEPAFPPPEFLSARQPCFITLKAEAMPRELSEYGSRTLAERRPGLGRQYL